jgi:nucleotide-binding universal stress UspA family protein
MPGITRILVATDFSAASDAALTYARSLARQFGASINLVHVIEDPCMAELARQQLGARVAGDAGSPPVCNMDVLAGSAANRIVEHANETHADLIVIGRYGRSAFGHLLLGSVAEKVVRTATCPVLTARPAPQPAAA